MSGIFSKPKGVVPSDCLIRWSSHKRIANSRHSLRQPRGDPSRHLRTAGYVAEWHLADIADRRRECLLSGVKRTLFHAAWHVR